MRPFGQPGGPSIMFFLPDVSLRKAPCWRSTVSRVDGRRPPEVCGGRWGARGHCAAPTDTFMTVFVAAFVCRSSGACLRVAAAPSTVPLCS